MKRFLVALDTNVLVAAVVFGGAPRRVMEAVIQGQLRIALSRPLLEELLSVLEGSKFQMPPQTTQLLADELVAIATIVHPRRKITAISRDPDDDRVLDCAVAANAAYIISGDDDLLTLRKYRAIRIMSPGQFLRTVLAIDE